jgi:hypothetical protein
MIKLSDLNKDWYNPGDVANMVGKHVRTIQNYCNDEKIVCHKINGRRIIPKSEVIKLLDDSKMLIKDDLRKDVIYARVSTSKQKQRGDLDKQIRMISEEVVKQNPKNLEIITDVASGLNDNRKGLNRLLDMVMNKEVDRIFILYKDRLTRFGFNYLKRVCKKMNTSIIVLSDSENKSMQEELAEDLISIIHSFSGNLYGMREIIKKELE